MQKNKIIIIFIFFILYSIINTKIYSCNFEYIVDTIGIPKLNTNKEVLNHEIYDKYNVFVYSSPEQIKEKTNLQRFKEVSDKGKYLYNGIRGEFFILGTNYNGDYIYNVNFPVDFMPESLPETWNYIYYKSFEDSWNNSNVYEEQMEYMKNSNLMFDKIDLINKVCDSYNLVEYDIIPSKVGLGKFRLNTVATWKTMGIVTAKRRLKNGVVRDVIFATKPMAIDADIKSFVNLADEVYMDENEDEKNISIEFGANAINLNSYAKPEHIKKINSEVYINGEYIDSVSGSKTAEVDKKINYVVSREKNNIDADEISLKVEVKSYLYTEFLVDGLMYDIQSKEIIIKIAPKKLVPVKYIKLNLLCNKNESLVVSPLVQTIETKNAQSSGFIEQGRRMAILLDLNEDIEKLSSIKVHVNNIECKYNILKKESNFLIIEPNLEDVLYISIAGWRTIRDNCDSYFEVMTDSIGDRVKESNVIDVIIKLIYNEKEYEYRCFFDVFDNYLNNINYKYCNNILNYEELENEYEI